MSASSSSVPTRIQTSQVTGNTIVSAGYPPMARWASIR